MAQRVTQADVARLAGVSQATVSLVLNSAPDTKVRVGEGTKRRVLAAIQRTGYTANPFAQGLARGRNHIVGVFTYESVFPKGSADFFSPFLEGIEAGAEELGLDLMLFTSVPSRNTGHRTLSETGWNRVAITDGCILLGRHDDRYDTEAMLAQRFPFVFVGRRDSADRVIPYVGANYRHSTRHVVEHLLALGHRRIAFLGDLGLSESATDRHEGYRDAMTAAGLRPMIFSSDAFSADEAIDLIVGHAATAAVLGSDYRAAEIRAGAVARGLDVPRDLSLALLGQPTTALADEQRWTGFRIPREQMGLEALRLLAAQIEGRDELELQRLLPCTFVEGETVMAR
ncbi:LacI family DNA-binding transcriptional regulator [Occultella glacieicola]|uniref:LacI family DNA-binding transcriptional regulator n=1 Tax=Occultella glacieicola TaxID=2518684 RepID=UPI001404B3BF|nr:LacI family DNA-binding transcriptional regulator [Occultella glacieicola]